LTTVKIGDTMELTITEQDKEAAIYVRDAAAHGELWVPSSCLISMALRREFPDARSIETGCIAAYVDDKTYDLSGEGWNLVDLEADEWDDVQVPVTVTLTERKRYG
jgi:hypothetical protein